MERLNEILNKISNKSLWELVDLYRQSNGYMIDQVTIEMFAQQNLVHIFHSNFYQTKCDK